MVGVPSLRALREIARPYYLKWWYFRLTKGNRPPHFYAYQDYPMAPLGPEVRAFAVPRTNSPDFVILPMVDWHTRTQRTQHFASTLASLGSRCIYVNPHLGREFQQPFPFSSPRNLVSAVAPGVLELHVHLPREPVFHERCLREPEVEAVTRSILTLLHEIGANHDRSNHGRSNHSRSNSVVVLISLPSWAGVARRLQAELNCALVNDCHDLLEGFENIGPQLIAEEVPLMHAADLIMFSSDALMRHYAGKTPDLLHKSILVRNAVSAGDFKVAPVKSGESKTIGYVGSLESWFDVETIRVAAERHPEWRFVLVGRKESAAIDSLATYANVHFTGERPYSELPELLAGFDVALIPFLVRELTMATNPVKLYEYFACGLPVVSAPLPEVQRYAELVYIASTPDEFATQIERALSEDSPALRQRRRHVAESESWVSRCELMLNSLRSMPKYENHAPA